jgi:hypothetical protein
MLREYAEWMLNALEFVMLYNPAQQPLYILTWKHQSLFSSFLSFFPSSYTYTFISVRDCTTL